MKLRYLFFLMILFVVFAAQANSADLKFRPDGTFKILLMSDAHCSSVDEEPYKALAEKLITIEKPDLVVMDGDNITSNPGPGLDDLKKAIANVAEPMEKMKVPWAVVFGNHDWEPLPKLGLTQADMMAIYESYPYNVNSGWQRGITGVGNKCFYIYDQDGLSHLYNIWLLDSNNAPKDPKHKYDWIHIDQVMWYYNKSKEIEALEGCKIPGLMFFHIPLPEFGEMATTKNTIGERHEHECPSMMNSGMFTAIYERGDVKGVFCGHDHVNNYVGKWNDILLGYAFVVGYRGYPHTPPDDKTNDRARGARVFLLEKNDLEHFKTWIRFKDGTTNWESWSGEYMKSQLKYPPPTEK